MRNKLTNRSLRHYPDRYCNKDNEKRANIKLNKAYNKACGVSAFHVNSGQIQDRRIRVRIAPSQRLLVFSEISIETSVQSSVSGIHLKRKENGGVR